MKTVLSFNSYTPSPMSNNNMGLDALTGQLCSVFPHSALTMDRDQSWC